MGGGPESRHVGCVYGLDGAVHGKHCHLNLLGGSHGTCSYTGMYINALADSVMLQLLTI